MDKIPLSIIEKLSTIIYTLERPLNKKARLDLAIYVRTLKNEIIGMRRVEKWDSKSLTITH